MVGGQLDEGARCGDGVLVGFLIDIARHCLSMIDMMLGCWKALLEGPCQFEEGEIMANAGVCGLGTGTGQ